MNYNELMITSAEKFSSIICMGMDPVLEDIPEHKSNPGDTIQNFYESILNEIVNVITSYSIHYTKLYDNR